MQYSQFFKVYANIGVVPAIQDRVSEYHHSNFGQPGLQELALGVLRKEFFLLECESHSSARCMVRKEKLQGANVGVASLLRGVQLGA